MLSGSNTTIVLKTMVVYFTTSPAVNIAEK